jgi:LmbE family N-acetylglucosaminyl deacetylase
MAQNRPVPTFDHLAKKKPLQIREWIALEQDAADALVAARDELERQKLLHHDDPTSQPRVDAQAVYDAARDAARAASVEVVFQAISRPVYKALKRAHPPTTEQDEESQARYGAKADVNVDTFAPELIAASCVQPKMTPEQVASLQTEYGWNEAEFIHLYQLALRVNEARTIVNLDFS